VLVGAGSKLGSTEDEGIGADPVEELDMIEGPAKTQPHLSPCIKP